MGHNSYKQENLVRVAEFFRDSDGKPVDGKYIDDRFGIPRDQRLAIMRLLIRRKYVLKIGASNAQVGITYLQNPDFQGVFADAVIGYRGDKHVDSHQTAGRQYVPPPNKEPWEPVYIKELLKHKKLCESTR
jgi:hypothetical protein